MNREDVIRLAREAAEATGALIPSEWNDPLLERFAALVKEHLIEQGYRQCAVGQRTTQFCGMVEQARKEEREACAHVCDGLIGTAYATARECSAAIRERGEK